MECYFSVSTTRSRRRYVFWLSVFPVSLCVCLRFWLAQDVKNKPLNICRWMIRFWKWSRQDWLDLLRLRLPQCPRHWVLLVKCHFHKHLSNCDEELTVQPQNLGTIIKSYAGQYNTGNTCYSDQRSNLCSRKLQEVKRIMNESRFFASFGCIIKSRTLTVCNICTHFPLSQFREMVPSATKHASVNDMVFHSYKWVNTSALVCVGNTVLPWTRYHYDTTIWDVLLQPKKLILNLFS